MRWKMDHPQHMLPVGCGWGCCCATQRWKLLPFQLRSAWWIGWIPLSNSYSQPIDFLKPHQSSYRLSRRLTIYHTHTKTHLKTQIELTTKIDHSYQWFRMFQPINYKCTQCWWFFKVYQKFFYAKHLRFENFWQYRSWINLKFWITNNPWKRRRYKVGN